MKYLDEFNSRKDVLRAVGLIKEILPAQSNIQIMEVCGTHTQAFFRSGLSSLLPENLKLIPGPGCPVCVSDQAYIDQAIIYSRLKEVIIVSFGDMLRVPGTNSSLEKEKAQGAKVKVVYSPLEGLEIAKENPDKKIIFLAVGFEPTACAIALSLILAKKEEINNYFIFPSLKLIPPAMEEILKDRRTNIQGFLCPGHVSVIIGEAAYKYLAKKYNAPCVIAGFEPLDMAEGLLMVLRQVVSGKKAKVENQYTRLVRPEGNLKAKEILKRVFRRSDASWRGIGVIPGSGLELREGFARFDAEKNFGITDPVGDKIGKRCLCGEVIKGIILPVKCKLFAKACTPQNPFGPCMVASEGACGIYYKNRNEN